MAKVFQVDTGGTLTTSLVSYFKLEDATDFFGPNNLTNNGSCTFTTGKVGNALNLTSNGSSQYLSIGSPLSVNTTNITMACWVNLPDTSRHGCFMHNGSTTGGNGYSIGVGNGDFSTNGNTLMLLIDSVAFVSSTISIGTGWHLVGVSRNATTWKFWLDGAQVGTTSTTSPGTPAGAFFMGNDYNGTDRFFNNLIDEAGFWNKELSTTEWSNLYNGGSGQTMINSSGGLVTHNLSLLGVGL